MAADDFNYPEYVHYTAEDFADDPVDPDESWGEEWDELQRQKQDDDED